MAEYIERESVISLFDANKWQGEICIDAVKELPAADVVPVVRCKDCKYYSLCGRPPFMFYQCTRQGVTITVGENDFCNYGEK